MKKDIKSLSYDELSAELKAMGEPSFRAKQIYAWLHQRTAADFSQMTDLSKGLREKLRLGGVSIKLELVGKPKRYAGAGKGAR